MSTDRRRSDTQITLEILSTIKNGEKRPTRIMYSCNLSHTSLMNRIDELNAQNLIRVVNIRGKECYDITTKGNEMITHLDFLRNTLKL